MFMLEMHLCPSDYTLSFNIKTSMPSAHSPLTLFSSGLPSFIAEQMIISCPLHPSDTPPYFRPDWLCSELQLLFFSFWTCVWSVHYAATYLTPKTHSNTLELSLLCAAWTWKLALPGHMHHICWANKIIPDHNLLGETNERNIKMTQSCTQGNGSTIVCNAFKCGVSRANLKTLTIT